MLLFIHLSFLFTPQFVQNEPQHITINAENKLYKIFIDYF